MILIWINLLISMSYGVNLVQESQDVYCSNKNTQVVIDQRDRYIEVLDLTKNSKETYHSFEFLDSAILLKHNVKKTWAHIQLTPKNTAVLTIGTLFNFKEAQCKAQNAGKLCGLDGTELFWSPTLLKLKNKDPLDVYHYGVYPNDGTYFIAQSEFNSQGLALIDFGSNLNLIQGMSHSLECRYK